MKTINEELESKIPAGKNCNPDTSRWPNLDKDCPYHRIGIFCALQEEMVGNDKMCEINLTDEIDKHTTNESTLEVTG